MDPGNDTRDNGEMLIEEVVEPPPWVLQLMKYSEDLVLKAALGDSESGVQWLANGRAAISQDGSTCVAVVDDVVDEVLPEALFEDVRAHMQPMPEAVVPPSPPKNHVSNSTEGSSAAKSSVYFKPQARTPSRALSFATPPSSPPAPSRPAAAPSPVNNLIVRTPTIPLNLYLKNKWKRQWNLRSLAVHYPPREVRRTEGRQILYFCQTCPRVHDNLALQLALWMSKSLNLPLQVLTFLPRLVAEARTARKSANEQWRSHCFRRKAFAKFHGLLATMKVPLVGLVVEDQDVPKVLLDWERVYEPHFIVTDDTHSTYRENAFKRYVQESKLAKCAIFSMDSTCIYPPRMMRRNQPPGGGASSGKAPPLSFGEYQAQLNGLLFRKEKGNVCNLFDNDWCSPRFDLASVPDPEVQQPLYLRSDGGVGIAYVHDDIANVYDVIHWTSAMDLLQRAVEPLHLDGSEEQGLRCTEGMVRNLTPSGRRAQKELILRGTKLHASDLENVLAYVRMGSLSSRMVLRGVVYPAILQGALRDAKGHMMPIGSTQRQGSPPSEITNSPAAMFIRHHLVERLEYRLYRVRAAFSLPCGGATQNAQAYRGLIPKWLQDNLRAHETDARKFDYFPGDYQKGNTHDRFWNGCQQRLKRLGALNIACEHHWTVRLLEWSTSEAEVSFDLGINFLRKYLFGGHITDEVIGIVGELYHMHTTDRRALTDKKILGFVCPTNLDRVKQILGAEGFEMICSSTK